MSVRISMYNYGLCTLMKGQIVCCNWSVALKGNLEASIIWNAPFSAGFLEVILIFKRHNMLLFGHVFCLDQIVTSQEAPFVEVQGHID